MVADVNMNIIIRETFNEMVNIIDNEELDKENASPGIELQKKVLKYSITHRQNSFKYRYVYLYTNETTMIMASAFR